MIQPEESNLSSKAEDLKEVFVYPKNKDLKGAYICILGMMKLQKKIRFYVHECVQAIIEERGWITSYNPGDPDSKQDKNWKKALTHLKVLENPYFRFIGPGKIEIRTFDAETKRQVTNFDQFFGLCAADVHMSEYVSCEEEVIFDTWADVTAYTDINEDEIAAEIAAMNSAVPLKVDTITSTFETDFDKQEYLESLPGEVDSLEDLEV